MARTLNDVLRKRKRSNNRLTGGTRMKLSEIRKHKSSLERWMEPLLKKPTTSPAVVIVDTSDDDSQSVIFPSVVVSSKILDSRLDSRFSRQEKNDHCGAQQLRDTASSSSSSTVPLDIGDNANIQKFQNGRSPDSAIEIDDDASLSDTPSHEETRSDEIRTASLQSASSIVDDKGGRCKATTRRGSRCQHMELGSTGYCRFHRRQAGSVDNKRGETDTRKDQRDTATKGQRKDVSKKASSILTEVSISGSDDNSKVKVVKTSKSAKGKEFRGKPGEKRCLFRQDGRDCRKLAIDGSFFCSNHARKTQQSDKISGKRATKKAKTSKNGKDKRILQFGQDKLFTGRSREDRCLAISKRGNQCAFKAVNSTVYCHKHADMKDSPTWSSGTGDNTKGNFDSPNSRDDESVRSYDSDELSNGSDSNSSDENNSAERPYNHKEFLRMWRKCEEYCGEMTEEIEGSRRVRGANNKMSPDDTNGQLKAQYGRLLPRAMKTLMDKIMGLSRGDVFLDIGHGIGNTCVQAAYTVGCEARGIEVVYGRNSVAEVFRDNLAAQNDDNPKKRIVGKVDLRHGRLEDDTHQEFLTKGVTHAYVNNFNGVFAERSSKGNQKWFLDDYVAALFALMAPGSMLVSLHPINLGPTKSEANNNREKQGLRTSENASFYEVEKVLLGKACDTVKWCQRSGNTKNLYVYRYTRVKQNTKGDAAVFLCCSPTCEFAKKEIPQSATTKNEEGRSVINHCECKFTAKNLRRQRRKIYTDY